MSVVLDDVAVVLDGLEHDVPCTIGGDEPATVYVTCRHCTDNAGFLCDVHLQQTRARANAVVFWVGFICCGTCKIPFTSFDDGFKVVPL